MDEYSSICNDVAEQVASEFMDEIERLKKELEEARTYIKDLESELRNK